MYIIISPWPFLCQKLSILVEIQQSHSKNNFDCFLRHSVVAGFLIQARDLSQMF